MRPILERTKQGPGERIVIADARPAERRHHAELLELDEHRLAPKSRLHCRRAGRAARGRRPRCARRLNELGGQGRRSARRERLSRRTCDSTPRGSRTSTRRCRGPGRQVRDAPRRPTPGLAPSQRTRAVGDACAVANDRDAAARRANFELRHPRGAGPFYGTVAVRGGTLRGRRIAKVVPSPSIEETEIVPP